MLQLNRKERQVGEKTIVTWQEFDEFNVCVEPQERLDNTGSILTHNPY